LQFDFKKIKITTKEFSNTMQIKITWMYL